ncbi:MAG: inositol monophosphatase family protein, partial [Chloroflexota bacterium]
YAICVALMQNYEPTEAVLGLPKSPLDTLGTILYTRPDGLTAMDLYGDNARKVGASTREKPSDMRAVDSIKIPQADLDLNIELRQIAGLSTRPPQLYDSQIKYGLIAAGYADVFVRLPRDINDEPHYIWDHAPGAALLRAGGATYTDLNGDPIDFSQGRALPHTGFIASNGAHHDALVAAARERLGDMVRAQRGSNASTS